ncbi:hypothetical protein PDESU_01467 [Pontiella desulfatans]|uniref:Uncharacterized protein n=1 Tax=Pontiella desulfatans TaxID=2750659 RepID=A0A6C2TZ79_PONDE|nr:hypothetical protein PDESU_01467 [Pontiella desulfatans]
MVCECWMDHGVWRTRSAVFVCAECGTDVSAIFVALVKVDGPMADLLMEKGVRQTRRTGRTSSCLVHHG